MIGSEYSLHLTGNDILRVPSEDVVKFLPLNLFFGDVKGNPVPTNNSRLVTGSFTSYQSFFAFYVNFNDISSFFEIIMISLSVVRNEQHADIC